MRRYIPYAEDMAVYDRIERGGRIIFKKGEHPPPHFHAKFGSDEAAFYIRSGRKRDGRLAVKDRRAVRRWYDRAPKADVELLLDEWYKNNPRD